jgi:hypothetical protein
MKALIIFSLFIICYINAQILIYGFDNIDIKENGITFNAYTNYTQNPFQLWLNQNDNKFYCDCTPSNNQTISNFSCSNQTIKIKTNEQLSMDKEKNELNLIDLNTYASAQGKNLKRAKENKFPFENLDLDVMYILNDCYNATGENSMILINCNYSDEEYEKKNDRNHSAIFYIGDDSTKIAIPSKMTDIGENTTLIELNPPISFYNVPFHNTIGVSKKKSYLMQFKEPDEKFNFTYFSKNAPKKKGSKLSAGAILAIIIPSVLAIAAVIAIIILLASKSGAPVATSAPNPQTYNTLGLNSSSSVNKN